MSKEAAAKNERAVEVEGVKVGRVKLGIVRESLSDCLMARPVDGLTPVAAKRLPLEDAVRHLARWYADRTNVPRDKLVKCEVCSGIFDGGLEICPFCGDGEEEAEVPKTKPVAAEKPAEVEKPAPEPVAAIVAPPVVVLDVNPAEAVIGEGEKPSEALLDQVTSRLNTMKSNLAVNYWNLGRQIKVVLDRELWKMRSTATGKCAYTTFNQWAEKELRMAGSMAYSLMDVAKQFTEDQARRLGMTKLTLALKAPPAAQREILQMAEEGASKREIAEVVKQKREEAGVTRRETGRKEMPAGKPGKLTNAERAGGATKRDTVAEGRLTVAMVAGVAKLDMYAKPEKRVADLSACKRAKKLADEPIAREEMSNGVVRTYSLLQSATGIVLKIETRRSEK